MTATAAANLAAALVDQHAGTGRSKVALRVLGANGGGAAHDVTYADLADRSRRVAAALAALGVATGDVVATLLPRGEPLVSTLVGGWRLGAVTCSLFTAYGPDPVVERLRRTDASVLVTTPALYRRKVRDHRVELPALRHVVVVGPPDDPATAEFDALVCATPPMTAAPAAVLASTPAFVHCTSGTTGPPKVAVHTHGALTQQLASARTALDLRDNDVYWCTADPGWITGIVYGVIAPLAAGVTSIVDPCPADVDRWPVTLAAERVNVWYTAPTALRLLRHGTGPNPATVRPSDLRVVATVGEPLDADLARWARDTFGVAVRDTWWQTETGAIMIAHRDAREPLGSMGHALPGVTAAVLRRGPDGRAVVRAGHVEPVAVGESGELALRPPWPSMFAGYLHDDARYAACFVDGWYLTGDVVRRDAAGPDGPFSFLGRADDVIKSAGHLVGPFEVEQVLLAHPAVAEVGVVGVPDPVAGEVVRAYVRAAPGVRTDDELALALVAHARAHLGAALAPRSIVFTPSLPTTESGKIRRRALRALAAEEVAAA